MDPEIQESPRVGLHIDPQQQELRKEAELRQLHQEYVADMLERKKQRMVRFRQEMGSSLSSESSEQLDEQKKPASVKNSFERVAQQAQTEIQEYQEQQSEDIIFLVPSNIAGEWNKQTATIVGGKSLYFQSYVIEFKRLGKVKLIADPVKGVDYRIKMSYDGSEVVVAVANEQKIANLPPSYFVFAKIIRERMVGEGRSLECVGEQDSAEIPKEARKEWVRWGWLEKKSQIIGRWSTRFVRVTKDGIYSHKKWNEKPTMWWKKGSISEIWTRFDLHNQLLVVKVHQQKEKIEFGLPLHDPCTDHSWLYHFYSMMKAH